MFFNTVYFIARRLCLLKLKIYSLFFGRSYQKQNIKQTKIKNKNQKEHIYKALKPILPGLFNGDMFIIRLHTVY